MVHQQDHFCASNCTKSSLSNNCKREKFAANDVVKHFQTDAEEKYDTRKNTSLPCSDLKQRPFVCCVCPKGFFSPRMLYKHELSHSPCYVCKVCTREFRRMKNLKMHLVDHSKKKLLVCDECGKAFLKVWELNAHLFVHDPMVCCYCGKTFSQSHALKKHYEKHLVTTCSVQVVKSFIFSQNHRLKVCPKRKVPKKAPIQQEVLVKTSKKPDKPFFWDTLRKGFSKNYLKNRRQVVEKKLNS